MNAGTLLGIFAVLGIGGLAFASSKEDSTDSTNGGEDTGPVGRTPLPGGARIPNARTSPGLPPIPGTEYTPTDRNDWADWTEACFYQGRTYRISVPDSVGPAFRNTLDPMLEYVAAEHGFYAAHNRLYVEFKGNGYCPGPADIATLNMLGALVQMIPGDAPSGVQIPVKSLLNMTTAGCKECG